MTYRFEEYPDIALDCGSVAEFDHGSGISYRCTTCGAVVGSIAEPRQCREIREENESKAKVWRVLNKKEIFNA